MGLHTNLQTPKLEHYLDIPAHVGTLWLDHKLDSVEMMANGQEIMSCASQVSLSIDILLIDNIQTTQISFLGCIWQ